MSPDSASSCSLVCAGATMASVPSDWYPKILVRLTSMRHVSVLHRPGLQACPTEGLTDAVEDNRQDDDGEAAEKAGAGVVALQADEHRLADAARPDHRGDDHHGKCHDDRLVDALHDRGQGERELHAGQYLADGSHRRRGLLRSPRYRLRECRGRSAESAVASRR